MARIKSYQRYNVSTGKVQYNIKGIRSMTKSELSQLSISELEGIYGYERKSMQQKIRRLTKAGVRSPFLEYYGGEGERAGYHFKQRFESLGDIRKASTLKSGELSASYKGKLVKKVMSLGSSLNSESSTVTGARKQSQRLEKKFLRGTGIKISEKGSSSGSNFWSIVSEFRNKMPSGEKGSFSSAELEAIGTLVDTGDDRYINKAFKEISSVSDIIRVSNQTALDYYNSSFFKNSVNYGELTVSEFARGIGLDESDVTETEKIEFGLIEDNDYSLPI